MAREVRLKTILDGGRYFEGPRWHNGRLWFVDCMARTLLSISPSGERQEHAAVTDDTPCGLGVLPNGDVVVLTMFRKRLLRFAGGKLSLYADLSQLAAGTIDDMVVNGQGRAYVGDLGFDLPPPDGRGAVGRIVLVMPDGSARVVADGLQFPNGIAVSSDHRRLVVAEMDGACLADYDIAPDGSLQLRRRLGRVNEPDGICLDRDGSVWVASFTEDAFVRIDRDGVERERIAVPGRRALACALGGAERRTLFCLSAATSYEDLRKGKSASRIDVVEVETPGDGYP
ncbi:MULTISPECIES: SMP-30/gluconolactonase/LRE family protein [unclassified Bradyrhizobium]|uniref:SMP-30/gluconolactonase/LRE family protein n=1 Tax=unclassified Bradyrhizobium TaxID=2631580 RepID=UPI00247ACCCE|nr:MULTISPECIES: SMP-30/gluconolactonase/LRE family protein [unclassified Bradyrhizobium]WGS17183.1 SMP-30/gluconolactonase/LRE family protein [Bradyrhizobium sp. ISRA463]WGS30914.1 SMP-30/gluconolactonase/LRE family protein [Bradyrhizobium sp. ISRA464]